MTISLRGGAAVLILVGVSSFAQAQVTTNGEIQRGLQYRGTTSFDGEPVTQRYAYSSGQAFVFMNGSSANLRYMDYLDRLDRAEKFGYRIPVDPFYHEVVPLPPPPAPLPATVTEPAVRGGFGGVVGLLAAALSRVIVATYNDRHEHADGQ